MTYRVANAGVKNCAGAYRRNESSTGDRLPCCSLSSRLARALLLCVGSTEDRAGSSHYRQSERHELARLRINILGTQKDSALEHWRKANRCILAAYAQNRRVEMRETLLVDQRNDLT